MAKINITLDLDWFGEDGSLDEELKQKIVDEVVQKIADEDKAKCDFVYSFAAALEDSDNWYLNPIPKCIAKGLKKSSADIEKMPYSNKHILRGKIVLDHIDDLKAKKIMFDMMAQAKAEIEGII